MPKTTETTEDAMTARVMISRLILAAIREHDGVIDGGVSMRSLHDRNVHAFLPCPNQTASIYAPINETDHPVSETKFEKCPACWTALDEAPNKTA